MDDLVQKRLRYIERQKALHKDAVNVVVRRAVAQSAPARPTATGCPAARRPARSAQLAGARPGRCPGGPARPVAARNRRPGPQPGDAVVGRLSRAAAGRRRQRLPLRDDLEPLRQSLARRTLQDPGRTGRPERGRQPRARAPATTTCRARRSRTPRTCRWHAPSKTTCCWCTPGRVSRCRANMAARCA